MPIIETARLRMRSPQAADAEWIATEIARPEVQQWLTSPPHPYRLEHAREWLAEQDDSTGAYVVEADGKPLGIITLRHNEPEDDLGYWLRVDAWGMGYMTEATTCLLNRRFAEMSDPVPSGHIVGNAASRNVLRKLGFQDTHVEQKHCGFRGGPVDVQRMTLTAEDWAARPAP